MVVGTDRSAYDSQQLGVLDDLLAASARGPDVGDLFQHLCAVGPSLVPYDEAQLVVSTGHLAERRYAYTDDGAFEQSDGTAVEATREGHEPQLLDAVPGADRHLQSGLKVPVKIGNQVVGALALFSRRPHAYSSSDLTHAERLASFVSLALMRQRLADQARDAAVERQRSAEIEACAELLRTIADVLDVRTVFPRVSEIAKKMLPHDALAMVFVDRDRHFVRQAASPADFPDPPQVTTNAPMPKEIIIDDLGTGLVPVEPVDAFAPVVAAGYRSFLSVRIPAREQAVELVFWSKRPAAFEPSDVQVARRIGDYVALSVSHEQLVGQSDRSRRRRHAPSGSKHVSRCCRRSSTRRRALSANPRNGATS
jgi:GAF domain-containing protein